MLNKPSVLANSIDGISQYLRPYRPKKKKPRRPKPYFDFMGCSRLPSGDRIVSRSVGTAWKRNAVLVVRNSPRRWALGRVNKDGTLTDASEFSDYGRALVEFTNRASLLR